MHQDRWQQGGYEPLPDLLVEECISVRVNGDQLEPLEGDDALALLQASANGNVEAGQRAQLLERALGDLDRLDPALQSLAERRAQLAEDDHRRVREASLRSGEALRMRFRCEPSPSVDVIGLSMLSVLEKILGNFLWNS